jgi:DNA-binding GntR family transcriptional regulator
MKKGDHTTLLAARLREQIISGQRAAGEVLRQESLAATFGASRMPIREALRQLSAEVLVTLQANRGAVVAPLAAEDFREITEMRAAAEELALSLALPQLSDAQIAAAAAINDTLQVSPPEAFGPLNQRFHIALYQAAGRPRLLAHIASLHRLAERYIRYTIAHLGHHQRSAEDHQALLAACYRRDQAQALRLTRDHIEAAGEVLEQHLRAGGL